MSMNDPIADMLTRIRNANKMKFEEVSIPSSKIKESIAVILKNEGFINDFEIIKDNSLMNLKVYLKYKGEDKKQVITGIKRISKPGLRVYSKKEDIPRVLGGLGIAILSTSRGILSDSDAKKQNVGGEVLCFVW